MVVMENLNKFIRYLKTERNYSDYTIHNYELDITDYLIFLKKMVLIYIMLTTMMLRNIYLVYIIRSTRYQV